MNILQVIFVRLICSVHGGKFYEELSKFKVGLAERPQTYRKIEITNGIGSCCGADSCSDRD